VTGRAVGSGATNLVLDLKTRRQRGEDKVNYELNIGARQFKCTTIPIFRPDFGLVGAICINVDVHFLRDIVRHDPERLTAFFDDLLRTDFQLDENILSPDEYQRALRGKRHYLDEAIRTTGSRRQEHRLAAILFSDIVGFTALMASSESQTLGIVEANEAIHLRALAENGGRLLKRLGDGVLARFDSASEAVAAAIAIRSAVVADGRFQVRSGIHLGEIVDDGRDVYGDGINLASRIQGHVAPGEIGVSDVVYTNIRNKDGLAARALGPIALKGVADPVSLYVIEG
jgi:class 3 adenylate cyclase